MRHIFMNYFAFGLVVQEEMHLKDIFTKSSGGHLI